MIRPWKYEDILALTRLEEECFGGERWSFGMLASAFGSESFSGLLWQEDGDIAGYAGVTCAGDQADIETLAVAENYRRGGIGGNLVDAVLQTAEQKGVKQVFLEVRVSNSPAISLYIKKGFNGLYARTRYYPDGEDCLVMIKEL